MEKENELRVVFMTECGPSFPPIANTERWPQLSTFLHGMNAIFSGRRCTMRRYLELRFGVFNVLNLKITFIYFNMFSNKFF